MFRKASLLGLLAVAALMALSALAPMFARDAAAHAALVKATPANNESLRRPPTRVVLTFSEPLERELTEIKVFSQDQERVDEGGTQFDDSDETLASVDVAALDPGLYYVEWINVSQVDGHPIRGTYPFIVLNADGTTPAGASFDDFLAGGSGGELLPKNVDSALKWIALLSLAAAGGAALFLLAVVRPASSFLEDESHDRANDAAERWVVTLSHVLLPASFIASALLVLLTWNRLSTDTSLWTYLTSVRIGEYRLAGLVLVVVALAGADVLYLGNSTRKRTIGVLVLIAACVGAMLTYSMVSHSATQTGKFWSVSSDIVHFAASSAWLGALVMLPPVFWFKRKEMQEQEGFLFLANIFDRFSVLAGISVATVMATGLFNGLTEIPEWGALVDTTYGRVLLAKLILVLPLLAVAGLNAYVFKPRLVAAIDGMYQLGGSERRDGSAENTDEEARSEDRLGWLQRWLPRTIVAEIVLMVAVFAAVSVLTQTSSARGELAADAAVEAASQRFEQTASLGDGVQATFQVTPNRVGVNNYAVSISDEQGAPLETVTQVRLRFAYEALPDAIAPSELVLTAGAAGFYDGTGAYFTQPGNWRIVLSLRRSDGDDLSRTYVLPVQRAAILPDANAGDAFDLPFTSFTWNEVSGAFLILLALLVLMYRKQLEMLSAPAYRASLTAGIVFLVAGGVLAFGVQTGTRAQNASAGNPVAPTDASLAAGRTLFQRNCIVCHGVDGRGDGPEAANLNPAPTDFRLHTPVHTDPQFYAFISDGKPGSAMAGFGKAMSQDDIWNLVNFLRSEFGDAVDQ